MRQAFNNDRVAVLGGAFLLVFSVLAATTALHAQQPAATTQPGSSSTAAGAAGPATGGNKTEQFENVQVGTRPMPQAPTPTVVLKPGQVPAIKFDNAIFDFGRVRAGQEVKHDFVFTNTGSGPLEITAVRPSCGCTTAGQHDRIVEPGKSGKIPIKLTTANYGGSMTKTVTVMTNCTGQDATIQLQIKGELWQPVQVNPASAAFGRIPQQSKEEGVLVRKLTIVNNVDVKAKIGQVHVPTAAVKAEIKELEPGKKFELNVSLTTPLKPGAVYGSIEIATGVPETPLLKVPVTAFIVADVDVTPNMLSIPANRPSALQRQLYVRNNVTTPVKLSDLKSTNPALKLELKETQPGVAFVISVDVPLEYNPGPDGDKITFKTDHPSLPEISVPVTEIVTSTNRLPPPTTGPGAATAGSPATAAPKTAKLIKPGEPQEGTVGRVQDDHAGHSHAQPPAAKAPGK